MYQRHLTPPPKQSFFLFGPRGTGKTWWVRTAFPDALYFDLLQSSLQNRLTTEPDRLEAMIPDDYSGWVIIDEVQKVPALLNEVHRLIEGKGIKFILTGSSARTLRKKGTNLLAGRAIMCKMHPLTAAELGRDFDLNHSLMWGHLPAVQESSNPAAYLNSYVNSYLREEVLQEGLTRDLGAYSRFLETASFCQGQVLNMSQIAREAAIPRKTVEGYFELTEDLLLARRLPVFTRRAKRRLTAHPKFYFFDIGVYKILRPRGPLDIEAEINGVALESLVLQELEATNDQFDLGYRIYYWRTVHGAEVDFVLYGPSGLHAVEVKHSKVVSPHDLRGLKAFGADYPETKLTLLYRGRQEEYHGPIRCLPVENALPQLKTLLDR
ncbi:MAG: ATP-binding protein [Parachlamydiales bacterium]